MVTKNPRPNIYLSSAELSHRLTAAAMNPAPKPMGKAEEIMRSLDEGDKWMTRIVLGFICVCAGYAWWIW